MWRPEALEEAAHIDGSVFSFISAWNDFLFAKSCVISDTSLVSGRDGAVKD
ncbi:hypothetical protein [Streptomyces sp. HUAS ZL42]|uniref:hypothetical protein n=1 Tax=Streptomyces sp. HUAS ZL42 TaxID=3231715 RepID=UPI00345EA96C